MDIKTLYLVVPMAPLAGAVVAGLFGKLIGRTGAHLVTILGVLVAFLASLLIFQDVLAGHTFNGAIYTWLTSGNLSLEIGFLIDRLTVVMMLVVTFVSLMVHIYTIGYMADDPGYQRFFSYIALFTFSMLMLVMSNNFLQLFFGWEAVGLVSYLLIGFWFTRESAIYANLKAFMVNRVGDFGFLLGIALIMAWFGSLDYQQVFQMAPQMAGHTISLIDGHPWSLLTVICVLLFIGAMGKSAQFPLHVWLPDSMEGPTPISALIHAATMVTAGIFMVARMSPLFELSDTSLSFVMIIGAITALFMGFLGMIQNDIKRVIAYSTLSQLGYMTVALGASAYSAAIFHLMTHAFFKALLFLGAGSVIMGMHHDQDIRNMGGLKKYMPITWLTMLIGSLALIGTPGFSGFYSKDSIIEAVQASHLWGSGFAAFAVTASVFVTAFYSFRLYFLVFHGKERFHNAHAEHDHGEEGDSQGHHGAPHESPWVVTVPLVLLAIPSIYAGWPYIEPMLYGGFFGSAIYIDALAHPAMAELGAEFHGPAAMALSALTTLPFWLAVAGVATAYYLYMVRKDLPEKIKEKAGIVYAILDDKYGFDRFNDWFFAGGARLLGGKLWRWGDVAAIDGVLVNGSARLVGQIARISRYLQSGYIYHYAFAMIIGVALLATWFV
ncbi:MAG: NADH-quinone oxidoreductase subunit L [Hydrogenophilales bacterium CG03_land_8_20_14_0_80_62_28]|nr:NADH-quinone oxidoreductase subunit L [Betaproteobacteria bacterium]OIO77231.1 MAG: NADH-quinone oxidoreductase subunit L [Hydrogenophilaceae bacterium CG1_02_62_390]PIV22982.1 MAG: NADH-quinone oxidoreductase subunit L [Hydrogenophilales bacterium CG03_land_8_20_14_0_80_62_28]PIW37621.1 MAG: NADH-quinone oxidoreductase subunit L [Hydrogenophilales bacterium CG15_BIG_FIL_POST_REV_8_21_14_020_62_31]PIW72580.1 MAG: NADH-quinone oxidoreductase subunit L [Hydrogenophilales bacterium CG12_big_fil